MEGGVVPDLKFSTDVTIKIDGAQVAENFRTDLAEVVVDSSLYLPDMFTIQLWDEDRVWVDDASLDIGKEVEISVKTGELWGGLEGVLITGEITALEPNFSNQGRTSVLIRGYDKSHRLHRGKKTRTFLQKKDSDLVSTIAGEVGLSAVVDTTTVTYDYILQSNQTNMEFLKGRAERIGYQLHSADGNLYFKKGDANLGTGPTLEFPDTLRTFSPSWTASSQADKVIVRSWDPKLKQSIKSEQAPSSALNQGGMTQTGGAAASAAFSAAEEIVTDRPTFTVDEATALATGLSNDIGREFVQAEGSCDGNPQLKAGLQITVNGVGTRFSGAYLVTSATHVWNKEGYETQFSITGRQPNTLSHLLDAGNGHSLDQGRVLGVAPALVTNLNDPDDLGRIKVKYDWLGDNIESDWMRIATPMAGSLRGMLYLPEVNDEVLIAFEQGDVHRPYVVGALWSSTDKPPKKNSEAVLQGKVNQRVLKTRAGHLIILDDKEGEEQISVASKSGHTIILDDKSGAEKITVKDKTGNNSMVIDSSDNSMTVNVNGDFNVTAKGKINLTSTGAMTLKTQAAGKFEATSSLDLKGTASAKVEGGGAKVALQAGMVNLN
jgi:phage protein D/phage baseplate assembly protein gpV